MIWIIGIVSLISVLFIGYMLFEATRNNLLAHTVHATGKAEQFRIFFISDTHNRLISPKLIEQIERQVDIVIIGGDFADKRTSDEKITQNLKTLTNLAPTYFIWGNNDLEVGYERLMHHFAKFNVQVVCNDSVVVRKGLNPVRLCATDFNTGRAEAKLSLEKVEQEDYVLYATHSPEDFHHFYKLRRPLLSFAGHVHGGQIRLGPYKKFPLGHFKERNGHYELISNGYGTTLLPFRFLAKPQAHMITINFMDRFK